MHLDMKKKQAPHILYYTRIGCHFHISMRVIIIAQCAHSLVEFCMDSILVAHVQSVSELLGLCSSMSKGIESYCGHCP